MASKRKRAKMSKTYDDFDGYRYEMRGSAMRAIMHQRHPYVEICGGWRTEAVFTRKSLEDRLKILRASGYASNVTESALVAWPKS
jgi:hypothetical protein